MRNQIASIGINQSEETYLLGSQELAQMGIHACMNENCSYMHEFQFVHKIHTFNYGDELVIMDMTGS